MSASPSPSQLYEDFLRSRWPSRTHHLATYAVLGNLCFPLVDWVLTRPQPAPPTFAAILALRLPWLAVPLAGELLRRRAPGWRHLPAATIALSVVWSWASVVGYFAIGLGGSVMQAVTLFVCLVTAAAVMPLTLRGRAAVFALMALGFVAFDLSWPQPSSRWVRLTGDAAMLIFAVVQVVVFQGFAAAQRRGLLLRHRLEQAVADLAASRQRAAAAVGEVGRLAAEVGHEVNNPLAAVKVNVGWLASDGALPENAAERVQVLAESIQAVERIAGIVRDLRQRAAEQDQHVHEDDPSVARALRGADGSRPAR